MPANFLMGSLSLEQKMAIARARKQVVLMEKRRRAESVLSHSQIRQQLRAQIVNNMTYQQKLDKSLKLMITLATLFKAFS